MLIHAYVPIAIGMTNHVHMISRNSNTLLEAIMRDMKKFTSNKIIESIKKENESRKECLPAGQAGMPGIFRERGRNYQDLLQYQTNIG